MNLLFRFVRKEEGQDLIEWALLAGFLSIASILTLLAIGPLINNIWVVIQDGLHELEDIGRCCD